LKRGNEAGPRGPVKVEVQLSNKKRSNRAKRFKGNDLGMGGGGVGRGNTGQGGGKKKKRKPGLSEGFRSRKRKSSRGGG